MVFFDAQNQSKRDFINIFNLPSPIRPRHSRFYLQFRSSQAKSPLAPLFIDETSKPVSHLWFQKHFKYVLLQSVAPAENVSSQPQQLKKAFPSSRSKRSDDGLQTLLKLHQTGRFHIKNPYKPSLDNRPTLTKLQNFFSKKNSCLSWGQGLPEYWTPAGRCENSPDWSKCQPAKLRHSILGVLSLSGSTLDSERPLGPHTK